MFDNVKGTCIPATTNPIGLFTVNNIMKGCGWFVCVFKLQIALTHWDRDKLDDIFKCIFLNGNAWISLKIPLKFVFKVPINNIPPLIQIMAWRRPGDKPLSEPRMESPLTHICVTRPQWVNNLPASIHMCSRPLKLNRRRSSLNCI